MTIMTGKTRYKVGLLDFVILKCCVNLNFVIIPQKLARYIVASNLWRTKMVKR